MNYSDYCKMKLDQCNFAMSSTSTTSIGFGDESTRAARNAVNKAVSNLKGAIRNQVENKKSVDTSKANKVVDADRLYEVEVGKEGTNIKPKLLNSNGFNKNSSQLAKDDVKRKNDSKSQYSNTSVKLMTGNQVVKKLPEEYKTRQSVQKEFNSNLNDIGNNYA